MRELEARKIEYVRFELPDLHGIARSKLVPIDKVEGFAAKGLNLYGGVLAFDTASNVVPGTGLHAETGFADQFLFPDPGTLRVIPWLPATAALIATGYWSPDRPQRAAPRFVLGELVAEANRMGYDVVMGHEYEYYLLTADTKERLFEGIHIFHGVRNQHNPFLDGLLPQLRALGIDVITHNCEYAGSQFETNYGPGVNLAAADKAFTFKNAMKELAHRSGLIASFMTKPFAGMSGSGCHLHVSLNDRKSGRNVFFDPAGERGVSQLARSFIAGVLTHAPAMMPLINPTPNCYHRVKPHTFAPSNVSWGIEDRTAMVRIKATGDERTHIEMRAASATSNPYLAAAATLAAGLDGVKKASSLREQTRDTTSEDNPALPLLPRSLDNALDALEGDPEMRTALGEDFITVFTTVKRFELARFHAHITDWETAEYLELY
jgi:glutamine synthetase